MIWIALGLELLLMAAFAWVMAAARRTVWVGASDLRWREWHHAYLGWLLFALSFQWGGWWFRIAGLVLSADDALQHLVQLATWNLGWRSPLHRAYAWVYARVAFVRWLSRQLDRLFHG